MGVYYVLSYLFFLNLSTLILGNSSNIESIKNQVFFLEHAEKCEENVNLLEHLEKKNVINNVLKRRLLSKLTRQTNFHTHRRQLQKSSAPNLRTRIGPSLMSKQSLHQRRDEAIALLDLLVMEKSNKNRRLLQEKQNTSQVYLANLRVDIIDNQLLPDDELLKIASNIPCLRYSPEKNDVRYPEYVANFTDFDLHYRSPDLQIANDVQSDITSTTDTSDAILSATLTNSYKSYVIPNDPYSDPRRAVYQWHFRGPYDYLRKDTVYGVNLYTGWSRFRGESQNMVVGVVDSGCSMHPDLEDNLCKEGSCCEGKDYGGNTKNPFRETLYHGTSMAGAIAGVSNNGFLTAGACWGCKLMCFNIHIPNTDYLTLAGSLKAIDYMISKHVKVSNHSYRGLTLSSAEASAIERLQQNGHIFVTASGNMACDVDQRAAEHPDRCKMDGIPVGPISPSGYDFDNIIVVGSININGEKSKVSNWGKYTVDVMAPGEKVVLPSNTRKAESGLVSITGTSVASAIVAGVVALVWSSNPSLKYTEVLEAIYSSAPKKASLTELCRTGGYVDVNAALEAANGIVEAYDPTSYANVQITNVNDKTNLYYEGSSATSKISLFSFILVAIAVSFLV